MLSNCLSCQELLPTAIPYHDVEDSQLHAGKGLPSSVSRQHRGAECLEHGIVPGGRACHVERCPDRLAPPHTDRLVLSVLLLKGATPTQLICSGRAPSPAVPQDIIDKTGPTPGALRNNWSLAFHMFEERMVSSRSRRCSIVFHPLMLTAWGRIRRVAVRARFPQRSSPPVGAPGYHGDQSGAGIGQGRTGWTASAQSGPTHERPASVGQLPGGPGSRTSVIHHYDVQSR